MIELLEGLLGAEQLTGIGTRPISELRDFRVECSNAESDVSLVRRVAQGRIDIVGHEVRRRAGDDVEGDIANVLFDLPDILGGDERSATANPASRRIDLSGPGETAHELTRRLDAVASPADLSGIGDLDNSRVKEMFEQLRSVELELSTTRRRLHEQIDAVQSEIARRYRDGEASVDGLL